VPSNASTVGYAHTTNFYDGAYNRQQALMRSRMRRYVRVDFDAGRGELTFDQRLNTKATRLQPPRSPTIAEHACCEIKISGATHHEFRRNFALRKIRKYNW